MAPEKDDKKIEPTKDIVRRIPESGTGHKDLNTGSDRRKTGSEHRDRETPKHDSKPKK